MRGTSILMAALLLAPMSTLALEAPAAPGRATAPDAGARAVTDVPLLVDESGDTMTGDLAFAGGAGLLFQGGWLGADSALSFAGHAVCLAHVGVEGCAGGDVTAVLAGQGLLGGGLSGDVSLAVDTSAIQNRILGICAPGSSIRGVAQDGGVTCEADDDTTYSAGEGLALNGNVFSADPAQVQRRIAGSCAAGSSIRAVAQDGAVACEADDDTTYSAGDGLALAGTTFNLQACADGLLLKREAGAWACAPDATGNVDPKVCGYGEVLTAVASVGSVCTVDNSWSWRTVPRANLITAADSSAHHVGGWIAATVGADGLPIISYHDYTDVSLRVLKCGTVRCDAGNVITTVDDHPNGVGAAGTSIAIGVDGLPIISYYDATATALKVATCGNHACSAGNTITTYDPVNKVGTGSSIIVAPDGLPVIAFNDDTTQRVVVLRCGNTTCHYALSTVSLDAGNGPSIAIGTDGFPVLSYTGAAGLKVADCANPGCTAGTTFATIDSVGSRASLVIGSDGFPVMAYTGASSAVKLAKCATHSCSVVSVNVVDDPANTLNLPSLSLGLDGRPSIAYIDSTLAAVKFTKCGNEYCSVSSQKVVVEDLTSIGDLSMVLGADWLPLLVYMDADFPADLKTAHLANEFGINRWARRG